MTHKPPPPTALERLVLDRARCGLGPSTSERRRALDRLSMTLAYLPSPADHVPPEPAPPEPPLGHQPPETGAGAAGGVATGASVARFSLQALVTGVLTGALAGFGAGVIASSPDASNAVSRTAAPSSAPLPPAADPAPVITSFHEGPPSLAPAPSVSDKSQGTVARQALTEQHGVAKRAEAPPLSNASAGAAEATFYEELPYVRRAQSALQQGNPTLALGLMKSLDELQSSGALMAERNMTRVLALCQLDRTAEATTVARGMLSGGPSADVYRRRLFGSCAGAALRALEEESSVKDPVE